ncbi:hypothetical protein JRO89_XS01G0345500 [Xanthoceras sorbifolium]|uniref:Pentatricopeptide repeat-containing protein n=1 Tax=Xanthoceras sorbifolium TaxID=99658 RepID=A0ABQ8ING1_9ROSI|nr:hypothetical protein JRO89_XS01G0345500 [Xanthoceras sorbifolium]
MRHGTRTLSSSLKSPPLQLGNILLLASLTKTLSESGTRNLDPQSIPISEPLVLQVLTKNSLEPSKKLDFFRWCHSLGPFYKHTVCTYSHIFRTVCKAGFLEEVPSLLNSMKEDQVVVDSDTFKLLLEAFIKSGKFDSALEILDYMEELGTSLNPRVYDSVLVAFVKKNQVGLALSIFFKLLEACNGSVNDSSVVESIPGSFACNQLLVALKKSDMRLEFKQVFDKLREKKGFEFDTCGYNICIHAFGCWADLCTSLRLFKEMKEKSLVRGSFDPDLCTYNSLIQVLCFVGKVKDALIVWEELKVSGHEPDEFTYRNLIQGCCKSYRMDDAISIFNEMQYNGFLPNTVVYNSLLDGMFKARKVTEACQLFEKMVQDGVRTSCWTYNILIDGLFRNGRAEAGYTLFCDLKKKGQFVDAVTFSIVVLQLCREGHLEEALQLVEEMEGRGYVVDLVTITSLLIGFHKQGRWDWTERLMKHIRDGNLVPNVLKWKAEMEASMKNRKSKKKDYTPMFPSKDIREIMSLMVNSDGHSSQLFSLSRGQRVQEKGMDLASSVLDKLMKQGGYLDVVMEIEKLRKNERKFNMKIKHKSTPVGSHLLYLYLNFSDPSAALIMQVTITTVSRNRIISRTPLSLHSQLVAFPYACRAYAFLLHTCELLASSSIRTGTVDIQRFFRVSTMELAGEHLTLLKKKNPTLLILNYYTLIIKQGKKKIICSAAKLRHCTKSSASNLDVVNKTIIPFVCQQIGYLKERNKKKEAHVALPVSPSITARTQLVMVVKELKIKENGRNGS